MLKIMDDHVLSEPGHTAFITHSNTTWSLPAPSPNKQFSFIFFFFFPCSTFFAALNQLKCEDTLPLNIFKGIFKEFW